MGYIELNCIARFHHKDPIWIHNSVESVGYGEYSAVFKLLSYGALN